MIALVPLICLLIVVSDMDAAAIKSMSCPGTTASSNCINAECSMTSADGTKKELSCPPGQTGITNIDGKTTVVILENQRKWKCLVVSLSVIDSSKWSYQHHGFLISFPSHYQH